MNGSEQPVWKKYLATAICTAAAFILAILFVTVGVIKTVFVLAVAVGGFFLGRVLDDREGLRRIINNYLGRF